MPIYFTTDVNSSAYGEVVARNNAGGRIENLVYYTIGTGIGAGAIQRGEFVGGTGHPEMGHYYVAKHPMDVEKEFNGVCPFHNGCLEGLAAGPSLEARTGVRGENIKLNSSVGIFKLTILLGGYSGDSNFPSRCHRLWVVGLWLSSTCWIGFVRNSQFF